MAEGTRLIRLALFGSPVAHSISPRVHGEFARAAGLDIDYSLIEATEDEFPAALAAFREGGGVGCNITLPLKSLALEQAATATRRAKEAGVANTLAWQDAGWHADTTDGVGLVRDLRDNLEVRLSGADICIVGAGGAAAGVLGPLLEQGPARLVLANRTLSRAERLARGQPRVRAMALGDLKRAGRFDLVIQATSLGLKGEAPPLPDGLLRDDGLVYDMIYGPGSEPVRALCERRGWAFCNGTGMLVEQAAESFELWTGQRPDTAPVIETLRAG